MKAFIKSKMYFFGLLFIVMLCIVAVFNASPSYAITSGEYTYTLNEKGEAVFKDYSGMKTVLEIPSEIDGHAVTEIGVNCLNNNDTVTDVIIPDSVTSIKQQAFAWNSNLKSVVLGKNVATISYQAFFQCKNLEKVNFPEALTSIGTSAFYNCPSLKEIHLSKNIISFGESYNQTGIPKNVFEGCTGIESFSVDDDNPKMCSRDGILYKIDEDKNIIGLLAYPAAKAQSKLVISEGITEICQGACVGAGFEEVVLPQSLAYINSYAFSECASLVKVTGGEELLCIEAAAFHGCSSLETFDIPDSVKYISGTAFRLADSYEPNIPSDLVQDRNGNWWIMTELYINGDENYAEAFRCLELVNEKRSSEGLAPLNMDEALLKEAMQRAAECATYFDHYRPNGEKYSYIDIVEGPGINAENIAAGQNSAEAVMNSWINSATHKRNILSADMSSIGIGCFVHNGVKYWVQLFSKEEVFNTAEDKENTVTAEHKITYDGTAGLITPYILPDEDITLLVGKTKKLEIVNNNIGWETEKCNFTNTGITWSSSDPETISVSSDGIITALKAGSAVITAESGRGLCLTKPVKSKALVDISKTTVDTINGQKYTGNALTPIIVIKNGSEVLKKGTDYTVTYENNIYPGTARVNITGKGYYTGTITKTFTINKPSVVVPKTISVRLAKGDYDAIYANWSKISVPGATVKYKIQYKVGTADWKKAKMSGTTKNYCTLAGLADGVKCYVKVTPYVKINDKTYSVTGKNSAAIYTLKKLNKPTVKKASSTKVKVGWNNISGESGYEVYKSTKRSSGFKLAKRVTSTSAKSTTFKVSKKKTYYYKVRAFKTIKISEKSYRVYGPLSSAKAYKLK